MWSRYQRPREFLSAYISTNEVVFREFPLIFVLTLAEFTIAMMLAKSKQSKINFLDGFFCNQVTNFFIRSWDLFYWRRKKGGKRISISYFTSGKENPLIVSTNSWLFTERFNSILTDLEKVSFWRNCSF